MLEFENHLYEIVADVEGWQITKQIQSDITLSKNEVARLGHDLFGLNAKLIGYRLRVN